MEEEIWLPIEGYTGLYEASSEGRVRSLNYGCTGRTQVLKPIMGKKGYMFVNLYKDGKCKKCTVHRLVAQAFLDNVENLPQVNHIDECKANNAVSNLEWCSAKENINYGTGIARRAAALSRPVQQLSKDGTLVAVWPSTMEAWRQTGVNQKNICSCCNGERHSAGGFNWRYAQ